MAQPASAQQIGKLNISGDANIFQDPAMTPFGQIVVDFQPLGPGTSNNVETTSALAQFGIFSGLGKDFPGQNVDFVLGPFSPPGPAQTPPGTNILEIGTFDFILASFDAGTFAPYPFNLSLAGTVPIASLTARGTLFDNGVRIGNFVGTYSTQFPDFASIASLQTAIENGTVVPSSVSASFVVSAVPEPATVALVATGLVAVAGVGLRRRVNG
jgi:hypothetical protein